jgi:hypothetical protein
MHDCANSVPNCNSHCWAYTRTHTCSHNSTNTYGYYGTNTCSVFRTNRFSVGNAYFRTNGCADSYAYS